MAVTAGGYTGRVVGYTAVSGYGTHGGLNTLFGLSTLEDGADPDALTDSVTVQFGDGDVAPGASVGRFTDFESFKSFDVRLPREAVHTFWRGIRDFQGQDQNQSSFLSITWDGDNNILGFAVVVSELLEGAADKDRRERNDEMRRKVLDSWR
jgi:hypothetical protein